LRPPERHLNNFILYGRITYHGILYEMDLLKCVNKIIIKYEPNP